MNGYRIKFFTIILLIAPVAYSLTESDIALLCTRARSAKLLNDRLSSVTQAVDFLKDISATGSFEREGCTIHPGHARTLLWNLGDGESLERLYQRFLTERGEAVRGRVFVLEFSQVSHPEFAAVVARDLWRQTDKVQLRGEFQAFEVPYANAYVILHLAASSQFFPSDVEAWANALLKAHTAERPERYLEEIRKFWEQNGGLIAAGLYDRVRPPKGESSVESKRAIPTVGSAATDPVPRSAVSPIASARQAVPRSRSAVWLWLIGGMLLLAAAWVAVTRKMQNRTKQPPH